MPLSSLHERAGTETHLRHTSIQHSLIQLQDHRLDFFIKQAKKSQKNICQSPGRSTGQVLGTHPLMSAKEKLFLTWSYWQRIVQSQQVQPLPFFFFFPVEVLSSLALLVFVFGAQQTRVGRELLNYPLGNHTGFLHTMADQNCPPSKHQSSGCSLQQTSLQRGRERSERCSPWCSEIWTQSTLP